MNLSEKIIDLRKSKGMSQEILAEKLNVSRQAVSRWEMGAALPDAMNILRLSKLFGVTADYLLNDEYQSDEDLPKVKEIKEDTTGQIMIFMVTLQVMSLIMEIVSVFFMQSYILAGLSFLPFIAAIGGFEYVYSKNKGKANENQKQLRKKFYKISAVLGLYFPERTIINVLSHFYPAPYKGIIKELIIVAVYIISVIFANLCIETIYKKKK